MLDNSSCTFNIKQNRAILLFINGFRMDTGSLCNKYSLSMAMAAVLTTLGQWYGMLMVYAYGVLWCNIVNSNIV